MAKIIEKMHGDSSLLEFQTRDGIAGQLMFTEDGFVMTKQSGILTTIEFQDNYIIFNKTYRIGLRDDIFVTDKVITNKGFDGVEDTDWENLSLTQ